MIEIEVDATHRVSGLVQAPSNARACYVVAHGAGAGMTHPFMASVADGLSDRGIATLRYQFPYMEQRTGRPDRPALAQATVRAAVAAAARERPDLTLFAGGKSFGGRMTSQAQAETPLSNVGGLAFLGFPLHAAKKPSVERARHLAQVGLPMLFLQGTRDALADLALIEETVAGLGARATLHVVEGGDHSFHVLARSGRRDAEVLSDMLDVLVAWIDGILRGPDT